MEPRRILFSMSLACLSGFWVTGARAEPASPGGGVPFNGRSSYAVVDDGAAFDLDAFSLAAWVQLDRTSGSQVFVNRGEPGSLFTFYMLNGRVRMLVEYAEGEYTHANCEAAKKGTWTHYAGTYDGRRINLYVNGRLVNSTTATGRIRHSKKALYIGALLPDERTLDGRIEDVCVWNRAISSDEVAQVASGAVGDVPAAGLISRWTSKSLDGEAWKNTVADGPDAVYRADPEPVVRKADGYRGIWYSNQRQKDEYVYKYSGGLGTYCAKHRPFAVYCKEVDKTFFCYGGTTGDNRTLLHMVSYYDHKTGQVPRPTILLDKHTIDAHDNPVIAVDGKGYIWIFSSSHGTARPSYISVSKKPYSIDAFERVLVTNFSYTQPYYIAGEGFFFPHTIYVGGRCLYQMSSRDGRTWTKPKLLAKIEMGHYEVTWRQGKKVGSAFNFHPAPKGLNWRTNLYYMETTDFGRTWRTAQGQALELPITKVENPALVHDYRAEGLNVYMKDLAFDSQGRPVILFLTSGGWESGPGNNPRTWRTARWTGSKWDIQGTITSDNNYDTGSLYIESDDLWRIIGPTETGPQPFNTGGEIAMWTSADRGATWKKIKQLTHNSKYNHGYCRKPIDADPDFYAIWADGHGRKPSDSRLYFCDRSGNVHRLPVKMEGEFARP